MLLKILMQEKITQTSGSNGKHTHYIMNVSRR